VERIWTKLREFDFHVGRWTVMTGTVIALGAFSYLHVHQNADLYSAFTKAVLAALLTMAALGVAERFWRGAKVKDAGVSPEGMNVGFESAIADAVEQVNARTSEHVEMINKRLYDLEKAVFKEADAPVKREE
jgi:hypothetical protein